MDDKQIATLSEALGLSPDVVAWLQEQQGLQTQSLIPGSTDGGTPSTEETATDEAPLPGAAYTHRVVIGRGGMGLVQRVYDPRLQRLVVLKTLLPGLGGQARARFLAEARITGQLQHPGIVPVHEVGSLPDGRPYYTMQEVQGQTMAEAIRQHGPEAPLSRRLIDAFRRVCEAVAYAHERRVIHRDLKPDNIMLGRFGEVFVLDWGLARSESGAHPTQPTAPVDAGLTQVGQVMGTPAYMAPEQAEGAVVGPTADVYALGGILYTILTGHPPHTGRAGSILAAIRRGPPRPVVEAALRSLPDDLVALCDQAMHRDPGSRPTAEAVAAAVSDWLDGAQRREKALAEVARADTIAAELDAVTAEQSAVSRQAAAALSDVKPWDPISRKEDGWALEDQAAALDARLQRLTLDYTRALGDALNHEPHLPEAHARLAAHYRRQHAEAEAGRRPHDAARFEQLLRDHNRGEHDTWLRGEARLTLRTDPPGAAVRLHRYRTVTRRLVPDEGTVIGTTPLTDHPVPMGPWLVTLTAPGHHPARLSLHLSRSEHFTNAPPGATDLPAIPLLPLGALADDEVYVPEGWFIAGGDPDAVDALKRQRRWCPGVVMKRYPVTHREYLVFLNDLLETEGEEAALARAPISEVRGKELLYRREDNGLFALHPEGGIESHRPGWHPDWPVSQVTWYDACAYAEWLSRRNDQRWRLPGEMEWEKAARGGDGRFYPWGDRFDPQWCNSNATQSGRSVIVPVQSAPEDSSIFGIRHSAGNVREWCWDDWFRPDTRQRPVCSIAKGNDKLRCVRGGSAPSTPNFCRLASRFGAKPDTRFELVGFRLARSVGRVLL